jgi:probable phosphoglycerate mutase
MTSDLSLVLVRHGETEWTERGRLHGRLDSPLSPTGRRHAEQAAQRLRGEPFEALYTSPLGRARQTAAILEEAVGLTPQALDGLAELDFGWLEGAPAFLWRDDEAAARALRPARALLHALSAERPAHFRQRVARALEEMTSSHASGRLLVVGHYAVFSCLLGVMMDAPGSDWRRYGPWTACAISEVRRPRSSGDGRGAGWEIVRLNDEAHLREGVSA